MTDQKQTNEALSPWWKHTIILILIAGFSVLIVLSVRAYKFAPPIPGKVASESGDVLFTKDDILGGQQVFLKYALMENGTIWGHGAYLGPDFSAEYLHRLTMDENNIFSEQRFKRPYDSLSKEDQAEISAAVQQSLKQNRYDSGKDILILGDAEIQSFKKQVHEWTKYFSTPDNSKGLPPKYIKSESEMRQLTAFFAWAAWASVTNRPGKDYTYTNNFPYDPQAGNTPSRAAILWSALSLIALLGGTAGVLFAFGKFDFLGWRAKGDEAIQPHMIPGTSTPSQRAIIKYFVIVALLFLGQVMVGGALAHYRVEPSGFYGINLPAIFPSNILRTWHLQFAIFWIATAFIAGGLFLAPSVGKHDPKGQVGGINFLFAALIVVVGGSLFGEIAGINNLLGKFWYMFGHQGWEYLDLGRAWQILLAVGLLVWLILLIRGIAPARKDPETREISSLFLYASIAIPLFYLPAMFFGSTTNFAVVDTWRFWIIHLWVEGFFELFATVMVAVIFYQLGLVSKTTAARVVYLDAILYLGSGIIGTGHHWYWTGQTSITMALAATFSALEVVPLTLLTLDAWDFIKVTQGKCATCGESIAQKHKWTFYFLMAVGFWNFVGAGVFGFLINLPIVSYFEVGTTLTPNHGHAAMMGVFGMLGMALLSFSLRQVLDDKEWEKVAKFVRVSFWGLNIGLALMVVLNLFPGGVMQLSDVLKNGYWHARSPEFMNSSGMRLVEWIRMPADLVFVTFGVVPILLASLLTYRFVLKKK